LKYCGRAIKVDGPIDFYLTVETLSFLFCRRKSKMLIFSLFNYTQWSMAVKPQKAQNGTLLFF